MIELTGSARSIRVVDDAGTGQVNLSAPGVVGQASPHTDTHTPLAGTPGGALFEHALANAGLTAAHRPVLLTHTEPASGPVVVSCPPASAGCTSLLVVRDSTGVTTFHRPDQPTPAAALFSRQAAPAAASPSAVTFTVGAERFAVPPVEGRLAELAQHFGFHPGVAGAKKALSILEYPVAQLATRGADRWIAEWDRNHHPTVTRWFPPKDGHTLGEPLSPTTWADLAGKKQVLLFIHGIFSSCTGAFGALGDDDVTWPALEAEYGDSIIGFDHPTISVGVERNAADFLAQIPDGVTLDVDIVCHSRGGLVARALAAGLGVTAAEAAKVNVRKIVFAATPNAGSAIVRTGDWSPLLDRLATLITLPARVLPGPVDAAAGLLAAVLELAKIVGVDTEVSLPGLEDMAPGSHLLTELAHPSKKAPDYFAAAADFTPGSLLHHLFHRLDAEERVVDELVFPGVPNDIAVPTAGIADPGALAGGPVAGFPVAADRTFTIPAGDLYWHCTYFDDPSVRAALVGWLSSMR